MESRHYGTFVLAAAMALLLVVTQTAVSEPFGNPRKLQETCALLGSTCNPETQCCSGACRSEKCCNLIVELATLARVATNLVPLAIQMGIVAAEFVPPVNVALQLIPLVVRVSNVAVDIAAAPVNVALNWVPLVIPMTSAAMDLIATTRENVANQLVPIAGLVMNAALKEAEVDSGTWFCVHFAKEVQENLTQLLVQLAIPIHPCALLFRKEGGKEKPLCQDYLRVLEESCGMAFDLKVHDEFKSSWSDWWTKENLKNYCKTRLGMYKSCVSIRGADHQYCKELEEDVQEVCGDVIDCTI
ncbi:hypothetical protein COLO4_11146 [Corchorus olitorius]|uniref:Uncharacterized protein n=1 Tax=Corchorus olitorius TaxID=93759 RepID=A0A1R3K5Q3_9ROSI|nr:hypothetical protein COLO4_11146 [Corchorus olitorius]